MNSSRQTRDSAADEQAALWAARLNGDNLDRAQRTELDAWLAANPAHRVILSEYCQFSADLEEQIPTLVATGAFTVPQANEPRDRRRWKWTFPRLAGITLAVAATAVVSVSVLRPTPQIQNFAMAPAQRGSRILSDGSRVELNANTSLRFENTPTLRRVRLAGGEVLFSVAKDPSRPFIVETPAGLVRVTGTTFNVRTGPGRTAFEVTVVEGSVEVHPAEVKGVKTSTSVSMGAGDQFSSRVGSVSPLSPARIEEALAWRQGMIVFNDVPLSEAAARFAQYHGCAIHVAPEVAAEPIGGRHKIEDLHGFLASLELALPRVKIQTELSGAVSVNLRPGS